MCDPWAVLSARETRRIRNGRTRIVDGLRDDAVSEVKNVSRQSLTRQLRDNVDFARAPGRRLDLYARSNTWAVFGAGRKFERLAHRGNRGSLLIWLDSTRLPPPSTRLRWVATRGRKLRIRLHSDPSDEPCWATFDGYLLH